MRSLALIIVLLAGLSLANAQEQGPVLYEADFEGQPEGALPPGWASLTGSWVTANDETGVLQQSETGFRGLAVAGWSWSDYDVAATIRLVAKGEPAAVGLVGYSGGSDCYRLSTYGDLLALWRESGGRVQALAAVPFALPVDQPHRFLLSLRNTPQGTQLLGKVWPADGPEPQGWAVEALDASVPLRHGRPGLFTGYASAAFSDFVVTAATGEILAAEPMGGGVRTGGRDWEFNGGTWQPPGDGQPLRQTALEDERTFGTAAYALLGGWAGCTTRVLAKAARGGHNQGFGIAAYWQDDGSCYQFGHLARSSLFLARRTPMGTITLATVPFAVDDGAWYALKLRVVDGADGVLLQGKIWPAQAGEPAEWQIEANDTLQPPLRRGEVAVWCLDDMCSFDDLSVRGN